MMNITDILSRNQWHVDYIETTHLVPLCIRSMHDTTALYMDLNCILVLPAFHVIPSITRPRYHETALTLKKSYLAKVT